MSPPVKANTGNFTAPPSVASQIARLPELPMPEIKTLWQRLFGDDTPTHNRQFLERRIAYIACRRWSSARSTPTCWSATNAASHPWSRPARSRSATVTTGQQLGTVLTRDYQGVEHRVIVTQDGQYDFQGRMYPSLSMIAREITGTRWSGPLFFGLKAPATPKTAAKKGARR
jgi:hypothetical protein